MDILFATTELAPYVKVGGLADVSAALTQFMTLYRSLFALLIRRVNSALSEREALRYLPGDE